MSEDRIACPVCGETFIDRRGLSSHARHKHGIGVDELDELLNADKKEPVSQKENEHQEGQGNQTVWKLLGGIGAFVLTIIVLKKLR